MLNAARRTLVKYGRVARNALTDVRHGGLLGTNHLRRGASYTNSDYRALDRIFAGRIRPDDVLVDVGCGVGRVLNWWLRHAPEQRAIGVELDPRVAESVRRRLRSHANVSVITGDASQVIPEDGTLFFVFNSFFTGDEWRRFVQALEATRAGDPRVRVLCYNCVALDVFRSSGRWDIETVDLGGDPSAPFGRVAVITARG